MTKATISCAKERNARGYWSLSALLTQSNSRTRPCRTVDSLDNRNRVPSLAGIDQRRATSADGISEVGNQQAVPLLADRLGIGSPAANAGATAKADRLVPGPNVREIPPDDPVVLKDRRAPLSGYLNPLSYL